MRACSLDHLVAKALGLTIPETLLATAAGADFAARLERACGRSAKVLELRRSPAVNDAAEVSAAAMRVPMAIPRGWRR
jgi:hypothetical protein